MSRFEITAEESYRHRDGQGGCWSWSLYHMSSKTWHRSNNGPTSIEARVVTTSHLRCLDIQATTQCAECHKTLDEGRLSSSKVLLNKNSE
jgi:hypothetical protein